MRFRDHRVVGEILDLALRYRDEGADELVFYDITASPEERSVDRSWVSRVARTTRHSVLRRRRHPQRRRRRGGAGVGRGEDLRQFARVGEPGADRRAERALRRAMRRGRHRQPDRRRAIIGCSSLPAIEAQPRCQPRERSTGCSRRSGAARAKSCSIAWRATACGRAMTSRQLCAVRAVCRVPLVASGGAGSPQHFSRGVPRRRASMRRSRPACFTPARSPFRSSSGSCAARGHRGESMNGLEKLDWDKNGGSAARHRAGCRQRRRAHAGLHESRGARGDAGKRPRHFLEPQQATALDQGRDLRATFSNARHGGRLRRRYAADSGAARSVRPATSARAPVSGESPPRPAAVSSRSCAPSRESSRQRIADAPPGSYTAKLLEQRRAAHGAEGRARKGLEFALASVSQADAEVVGEAADLLYHVLLLLQARQLSLAAGRRGARGAARAR